MTALAFTPQHGHYEQHQSWDIAVAGITLSLHPSPHLEPYALYLVPYTSSIWMH